MWKEFGAEPRWRVENPGRVVVMDGRQSTLFIKPDRVVRAGRNNGFVEWLRPLLDPQEVLSAELRAAQKGESRAAVRRDGPRITLTAARKAQGESASDWTRNTSVAESDHTRVYEFDAATGRLTGLQVMVHDGGKDTVVFEITEIRYNESIAPELFTVALPDKVISDVPPDRMPVNRGSARDRSRCGRDFPGGDGAARLGPRAHGVSCDRGTRKLSALRGRAADYFNRRTIPVGPVSRLVRALRGATRRWNTQEMEPGRTQR